MKYYRKWELTMQILRFTALVLLVISGVVQYASAGYTPPPCPNKSSSAAALFRDIAALSASTNQTSSTVTN